MNTIQEYKLTKKDREIINRFVEEGKRKEAELIKEITKEVKERMKL